MSEDVLYLTKNPKKYSPLFKLAEQNPLLNTIWRDVYQDDFPELLETFGFVTNTDLQLICELINLQPNHTLLDIGCGKGGPGLFVADQTNANLIGMDIDEGAITLAKALQQRLKLNPGLHPPANFKLGSFTETALAAASVDAIMSIDALILVPNKQQAIDEMARVLKPGGRFIFTTWDRPEHDLDAMLKRSGFKLICHHQTPDWKTRQIAVYQSILRHQNELKQQLGEAASAILISEASAAPALLEIASRVVIAAERC